MVAALRACSLRAVSPLLAVALLAAACGGGTAPQPQAADEAPPPPPPEATTSTPSNASATATSTSTTAPPGTDREVATDLAGDFVVAVIGSRWHEANVLTLPDLRSTCSLDGDFAISVFGFPVDKIRIEDVRLDQSGDWAEASVAVSWEVYDEPGGSEVTVTMHKLADRWWVDRDVCELTDRVADGQARAVVDEALGALLAHHDEHGTFAADPGDLQDQWGWPAVSTDPADRSLPWTSIYLAEHDRVLVYAQSSSDRTYCVAASVDGGQWYAWSRDYAAVATFEGCEAQGRRDYWPDTRPVVDDPAWVFSA